MLSPNQPASRTALAASCRQLCGWFINQLTNGRAGRGPGKGDRPVDRCPAPWLLCPGLGWMDDIFYRYFIYLLTAYDRSSNFFLGVARSEAMALVPGQWASSGAEGRGGHARLVGRTFISEMRHGENGFSTGRTCPLLLFVQGEAAWVGALLVGWASR